jgi:uncharacterized protein YgiB involved in biofilm formation
MRRSHVTLVLAGTIPLALAGCGPKKEDEYHFDTRKTYQSVQSCVDDKIPVDICSDAYMKAMSEHRSIAPTYDSQADCEADFVPGYCQADSTGHYLPKLGGFELAVSGQLTPQQASTLNQQGGNSGGGFGGNGFFTGLLLGNILSSGNRGNYYYSSQPAYQYRDPYGRPAYSTLPSQMDQGRTFGRSTQARSAPSGNYTKSSLGNSLRSSASYSSRSSVSSSVSRGGFGSEATARSGWGGSSSRSSGYSSGG